MSIPKSTVINFVVISNALELWWSWSYVFDNTYNALRLRIRNLDSAINFHSISLRFMWSDYVKQKTSKKSPNIRLTISTHHLYRMGRVGIYSHFILIFLSHTFTFSRSNSFGLQNVTDISELMRSRIILLREDKILQESLGN